MRFYISLQLLNPTFAGPALVRHVALRARFRDVSGWEGVDWYAPPGGFAGDPRTDVLSWGRHFWFQYWAAEHTAVSSEG